MKHFIGFYGILTIAACKGEAGMPVTEFDREKSLNGIHKGLFTKIPM